MKPEKWKSGDSKRIDHSGKDSGDSLRKIRGSRYKVVKKSDTVKSQEILGKEILDKIKSESDLVQGAIIRMSDLWISKELKIQENPGLLKAQKMIEEIEKQYDSFVSSYEAKNMVVEERKLVEGSTYYREFDQYHKNVEARISNAKQSLEEKELNGEELSKTLEELAASKTELSEKWKKLDEYMEVRSQLRESLSNKAQFFFKTYSRSEVYEWYYESMPIVTFWNFGEQYPKFQDCYLSADEMSKDNEASIEKLSETLKDLITSHSELFKEINYLDDYIEKRSQIKEDIKESCTNISKMYQEAQKNFLSKHEEEIEEIKDFKAAKEFREYLNEVNEQHGDARQALTDRNKKNRDLRQVVERLSSFTRLKGGLTEKAEAFQKYMENRQKLQKEVEAADAGVHKYGEDVESIKNIAYFNDPINEFKKQIDKSKQFLRNKDATSEILSQQYKDLFNKKQELNSECRSRIQEMLTDIENRSKQFQKDLSKYEEERERIKDFEIAVTLTNASNLFNEEISHAAQILQSESTPRQGLWSKHEQLVSRGQNFMLAKKNFEAYMGDRLELQTIIPILKSKLGENLDNYALDEESPPIKNLRSRLEQAKEALEDKESPGSSLYNILHQLKNSKYYMGARQKLKQIIPIVECQLDKNLANYALDEESSPIKNLKSLLEKANEILEDREQGNYSQLYDHLEKLSQVANATIKRQILWLAPKKGDIPSLELGDSLAAKVGSGSKDRGIVSKSLEEPSSDFFEPIEAGDDPFLKKVQKDQAKTKEKLKEKEEEWSD